MSRQETELSKLRSRANTSFASFPWSRKRPALIPSLAQPRPAPTLSLTSLIEALYPPAVPSLSHARSLATLLSNYSPLPRKDVLNPVLYSLCSPDAPPSIQAAGFDILAAYWENPESVSPSTAERLSYFSLFLDKSTPWAVELWEARLKAVRALTKYGVDIAGIEAILIDLLRRWIDGAFEGLLVPLDAIDRSEYAEREHSLDILVKFLEDVLQQTDTISRITEGKMSSILHFYASLVDRSISVQEIPRDLSLPPLLNPPVLVSSKQHPSTHRRNVSSLSSSSISSPSSLIPSISASECAIGIYLRHVTLHIKSLSHSHLIQILPVLFRALASCSSSLPRLSVVMQSPKKNTLEEKLLEVLNSLFSGPYAANCFLILRQHLFPQSLDPEVKNFNKHVAASQPHRILILSSLGAHRTLRHHVRRALYARIARTYISRDVTYGYSPSGAPGHIELQKEWMEKAWPKEDFGPSSVGGGGNGWDAARMGKALGDSVGTWVSYQFPDPDTFKTEERWQMELERFRLGKEEILEEAAGILKDILQELDTRADERAELDEDEARVIGLTLLRLSDYIFLMKNPDGSPFIIPIEQPNDAPRPILRSISSLLAQDHSRGFDPLLSSILIHVTNHLTDVYTARLPRIMMLQHDLSPTSPRWLYNWDELLSNETLISPQRPLTRRAILEELQTVYTGIKDMKSYRRPLGDLIWKTLDKLKGYTGEQNDDEDVVWKMLGEEVVLRCSEEIDDDSGGAKQIDALVDFIFGVAIEAIDDEDHEGSTTPSSDAQSFQTPIVSPILSRMQTDGMMSPQRDRDLSRSSVMSMLSSLASGGSSRSQSQPETQEGPKELPEAQRGVPVVVHREVSAVSALVEIFSQLTFTPYALHPGSVELALRVFDMLLEVTLQSKSTRARMTALRFLVRLRVDRDHHLYFVSDDYDPNGMIAYLAELVHRTQREGQSWKEADGLPGRPGPDDSETRKAPPKETLRGRAGIPSPSSASRSRSHTIAPLSISKYREPLWQFPETLPFFVSGADSASEVLMSYNPDDSNAFILPISKYLLAVNEIFASETSWEVLSYLLCHLPVQLGNKHLFCGPNCRSAVSKMVTILCTGILKGNFAMGIDSWPRGLKTRDAHGLAYQTLSVLIGYKRCFDLHVRHVLVEVFQHGLNGQLPTIKCCLQALALSAFELQPSITKFLSRILEMLSQIMSNPNMAAHILGFLVVVGSLPTLYVNFTEGDFKMVFGVALQYLQHYNQRNISPSMPWALAQYVRNLCLIVLYNWFLSLKLRDRPRHIRFIARQLLLANEGNAEVDDATEACFDWLARCSYATADPRPAKSAFSDIILNNQEGSSSNCKVWIMGNSIVSIRVVRTGWVEVMSRRPSGFSRFICHIENVPMVGPGEVTPDLLSVPATLLLERDPATTMVIDQDNKIFADTSSSSKRTPSSQILTPQKHEGEEVPAPDPITGYVWSGSAPSQRRKVVTIDPSFLILQLSPFPDGITPPYVKLVPKASIPALNRSVATLDRIPVIDTHKVGILYVAPGQTNETEILRNTHGSPAYTRFLEGIGRLINLRGQVDVYAGGLDPDEDGEYAYAWWDDIGQILYHAATLMPTQANDLQCNNKKRHIGNDYVRIVWNDSGSQYRFDTLATQFQFVNIVIEPHSIGSISSFSTNPHEQEYFKVTVQSAPGMTEFAPLGHFKLISSEYLPLLVRQLGLIADWYAWVFAGTQCDTARVDVKTNWRARLDSIRRIKNQFTSDARPETPVDGIMEQEALRDFTTLF